MTINRKKTNFVASHIMLVWCFKTVRAIGNHEGEVMRSDHRYVAKNLFHAIS